MQQDLLKNIGGKKMGRVEIEEFLEENPGQWTCSQICEKTDMTPSNCSKNLRKLRRNEEEFGFAPYFGKRTQPRKYWWKGHGLVK